MLLFKEKINYKLAGSGGFAPHLDSTAYTHVKNITHLTILLAVDATNMTNGGLEVVKGSHQMTVPIDETHNCIDADWVEAQQWTPVELESGKHRGDRLHSPPSPNLQWHRRTTHLWVVSRAPEWAQQQHGGPQSHLCYIQLCS